MRLSQKILWSQFLMLVSASLVQAEDACRFRLECENGQRKFDVLFVVQSNECEEGAAGISLEKPGNSPVTLQVRNEPYMETGNLGNGRPICHSHDHVSATYPAFAVDDERVLLFLRFDARPHYDRIGAVLVDVEKGRVLSYEPDLGATKSAAAALLKTKTGYKLRLVKEYLKEVNCDCEAAFVDEWMEVYVEGNHLRWRWLP